MNEMFFQALSEKSLDKLRKVPKSDLHNHAGRGGTLAYIGAWAQVRIDPPSESFPTLAHMQEWFVAHVKSRCPGLPGYLKRIEASFAQARADGIAVLALSFGIDEIDSLGGMEPFMATIGGLHQAFAPETVFLPELAFDRNGDPEQAAARLPELLSYRWFRSADLCGDEAARPIQAFKRLYREAGASGLTLKAHVGEFGNADDVLEAVDALELHEVQHGIAAAESPYAMRWLADHRIRLNVCPTSNVMLRRVENIRRHPIRQLYDQGVPVTINTDDLLIFDQSVSQEYLNLHRCGLMTAEELNEIRLTGVAAADEAASFSL
ncbi:hypothetical protein [Gorillibacterium sp. sgz500922]|uniref:hypothetical protein n=1 Tax=Gorillibacterium sp. sgz500922 TaxID=3446694 RepID=UPI003F67625D